MFGWILGLIVGAAAPIQTSVNNGLREKVKSPYLSSAVSFAVALLATSVALLIKQHSLALPISDIANEPWWIWMGGLCGTLLVICSILSMPHLGSAQTVMLISLGQILSGLLLDNFGWLGSNVVPLGVTRLAGAALVLGGVAIVSVQGSILQGESEPGQSDGKWLYRFLAFLAGCGTAVQISINGRLGEVAGDMFAATFISMTIALMGALCVCAIIVIFKGRKALFDDDTTAVENKWWMWVGGVLGFIIVCGNVVLAQLLGTGLSVVLNIAGQMIGGIVIDATGFLGIAKQPVTARKLVGVALIIAGVALVNGVI